jgi:hypothetical protein
MLNNLTRKRTPLIAWTLYFSVLFSAWMCAIGHGQMSGMQLSGLGTQFCSLHSNIEAQDTLEHGSMSSMSSLTDSSCVLSSLFSAILIAALFGLFNRLKAEAPLPLPELNNRFAPRDRWPLANPRASPALLPSL